MISANAIVQRQHIEVSFAGSSSRAELLDCYRQLRKISKQHHSAMIELIPNNAIIPQARRLGLVQGKTIVLDSYDDMNLVFDLLIYTSSIDRPRAVDRYARIARLPSGTDEALVLEAMQNAQFSILHFKRRHPVVGLIVEDLFRDAEYWLIDEGLESSLQDEAMLATRLYHLDTFCMTAGVFVPLDLDLIRDAMAEVPQLQRKRPEKAINSRLFAEAIYRTAFESGAMERVAYRDVEEKA